MKDNERYPTVHLLGPFFSRKRQKVSH